MDVNQVESERIGVLTFHMAHNYGAMLQAYALPVALEKLGYACEVIDYRFPYIDQWGRVEWMKDLIRRHGFVLGGLRWVKRKLTGYYNPNCKRLKFSKFESEIISRSKEVYYTEKELHNLPYDAILFGSDQIWNSELTNGEADVYVGNFQTLNTTKKIAYAASCGCSVFNRDCKSKYEKCLTDFTALGIREKGLTDSLRGIGLAAETVLDPSLLLDKVDWMSMLDKVSEKIVVSEPYILIYAFDEDDRIFDIARQIAKEKEVGIIAIAYEKKACMHDIQVMLDCGPADFVSLISNADMVITTSFHGTAFSIIMQKDFYCIPHPKYHERTDSLLELLNLKYRNITDLNDWDTMKQIDWDNVNQRLCLERKKSYDFLIKALTE